MLLFSLPAIRRAHHERPSPDDLGASPAERLLSPRISWLLYLAGCGSRHSGHGHESGRPRDGHEAASAGGLVPFPGMHLLQRVVPPLVAPDGGRSAAGQALAGLHRDVAGGGGQAGRRGPARHDEEIQRPVPDAGRRGRARGRRRHLLLHRRPDRARYRHRSRRRGQGHRLLGQLRLERLHPGGQSEPHGRDARSTR